MLNIDISISLSIYFSLSLSIYIYIYIYIYIIWRLAPAKISTLITCFIPIPASAGWPRRGTARLERSTGALATQHAYNIEPRSYLIIPC